MDHSQKQLWSSYVNSVGKSVKKRINLVAIRSGLTSSLREKRDALADRAILTNKHRVVFNEAHQRAHEMSEIPEVVNAIMKATLRPSKTVFTIVETSDRHFSGRFKREGSEGSLQSVINWLASKFRDKVKTLATSTGLAEAVMERATSQCDPTPLQNILGAICRELEKDEIYIISDVIKYAFITTAIFHDPVQPAELEDANIACTIDSPEGDWDHPIIDIADLIRAVSPTADDGFVVLDIKTNHARRLVDIILANKGLIESLRDILYWDFFNSDGYVHHLVPPGGMLVPMRDYGYFDPYLSIAGALSDDVLIAHWKTMKPADEKVLDLLLISAFAEEPMIKRKRHAVVLIGLAIIMVIIPIVPLLLASETSSAYNYDPTSFIQLLIVLYGGLTIFYTALFLRNTDVKDALRGYEKISNLNDVCGGMDAVCDEAVTAYTCAPDLAVKVFSSATFCYIPGTTTSGKLGSKYPANAGYLSMIGYLFIGSMDDTDVSVVTIDHLTRKLVVGTGRSSYAKVLHLNWNGSISSLRGRSRIGSPDFQVGTLKPQKKVKGSRHRSGYSYQVNTHGRLNTRETRRKAEALSADVTNIGPPTIQYDSF